MSIGLRLAIGFGVVIVLLVLQEQAQRLARAVSVFKLQTTVSDAQAQTPRGPQLARSNQALAAA
jgi:hypothetical protein